MSGNTLGPRAGERLPGRAVRCLAAVALLAGPAAAHDLWLEAAPARPAVGDLVSLRLLVGHGGAAEAVPRDPARIVRFFAVPADGDPRRGAPDAVEVVGPSGLDPAGYFRPGRPGTWAVGYETTPLVSELPAEKFAAYLEEEGLDAVRTERRERGEDADAGRELYSRSVKALVPIGGEPLVDRPIGLPLEIVLEALSADRADLRVLLSGEPLGGTLVDLALADGSRADARRTDPEGRLSLPVGPGDWVAATVVAHRLEDPDTTGAEWRSLFATLAFPVAPGD